MPRSNGRETNNIDMEVASNLFGIKDFGCEGWNRTIDYRLTADCMTLMLLRNIT